MLRLVDLANRSDFSVGPLRISPARRSLEGPGGSATVEPIVMKVLLMLFDARGSVVTRDDLFATAWGGVFVGDDSLNRAIARARKTLSESVPGSFEIETIPRTGYRLVGEAVGVGDEAERGEGNVGKMSRRTAVGAAAGVLLAGGAGFGLWSIRSANDRFDALVARGEQELDYGDGGSAPVSDLRQAVAIRPRDARAQGLLAFALTANNTYNVSDAGHVDEIQQAANASLRVDPSDPDARLALIDLQLTLDMAETEDRLRAVLASAPANIYAMRRLWSLLQCAGRSRDALALVQRAIGIKPLAASNNYPLAQLLWIVGRTAEADRVIDRAMEFWPDHQYVRFARFTIFAFTGRPRAALAMLDSEGTRPQNFFPASVALWRASLPVIDNPSPANIAKARDALLDDAKRDPRLSSQAVLTLATLGEVDAAFEVANNLLVFSAPGSSGTAESRPDKRASSSAWRFTPWLFTPPVAALRKDPRFDALADGIGLTEYWQRRGIDPDYKKFER